MLAQHDHRIGDLPWVVAHRRGRLRLGAVLLADENGHAFGTVEGMFDALEQRLHGRAERTLGHAGTPWEARATARVAGDARLEPGETEEELRWPDGHTQRPP